jgi:NAD(P)-dependent dehydrogenase (short-subunit alcohol dehydrogenase family)
MMLEGTRALITGASQGFGYAIARRFAASGARVFLCARDGDRLQSAGQALRDAVPAAAVFWSRADVANADDVGRLVRDARTAMGGLDVLVCNAGVYGPKGRIEDVDWGEWMQALAINLCGAVHCCRAVVPHFRAAGRGKIVLVSGGGATRPMPFLSAYAASKAALVRFGETLAQEVRDAGIDVNAVAPGGLNTRLLQEALDAGPDRIGRAFYDEMVRQQASGGTPLETGAALCAFLASRQSDGITGRLISAVWDPWPELPQHRGDLDASDVYTLRRIVPADRHLTWGRDR